MLIHLSSGRPRYAEVFSSRNRLLVHGLDRADLQRLVVNDLERPDLWRPYIVDLMVAG